jgi:hypothetical protein
VNGQVAPGTGYKELAATATQGLADVGGSVGDMYQVGVTTVDDAGNESVMAVASSCARLIDASGFCDAVDGGCPSGCATAAPGGDAGGLFGLLALGPVLLVARRRWRR